MPQPPHRPFVATVSAIGLVEHIRSVERDEDGQHEEADGRDGRYEGAMWRVGHGEWIP